MNARQYQFDWDDKKAATNLLRHRVSFELAATVFFDPGLLTTVDLEHGPEERWFSIGSASDGRVLAVSHLWSESQSTIEVRIISARRTTRDETRHYEENQ